MQYFMTIHAFKTISKQVHVQYMLCQFVCILTFFNRNKLKCIASMQNKGFKINSIKSRQSLSIACWL